MITPDFCCRLICEVSSPMLQKVRFSHFDVTDVAVYFHTPSISAYSYYLKKALVYVAVQVH